MKYLTVLALALFSVLQADASVPEIVGSKKICVSVLGVETICVEVSSELRIDPSQEIHGTGIVNQETSSFLLEVSYLKAKSGQVTVLRQEPLHLKSQNLTFSVVPGKYNLRDGKLSLKISIED